MACMMEPPPPLPPDDGRPYEELLAEATRLADRIESGQLPLEQALEAYAEGARLLRACGERLRVLEDRARVLVADGGEWKLEPLDGE